MFTLGSVVKIKLSDPKFSHDSIPHKLLNSAMRERLKADKRYLPKIKKDE